MQITLGVSLDYSRNEFCFLVLVLVLISVSTLYFSDSEDLESVTLAGVLSRWSEVNGEVNGVVKDKGDILLDFRL